MVLTGPPGTGKSHAGRFVVKIFNNWIWDAICSGETGWPTHTKPSADKIDWSKFVRQFDGTDEEDKRRLMEDTLSNHLLFIDDLGSEVDRFKSGQNKALLREFLDECRNKWVLISTNTPREKWSALYDARVASRLSAARYVSTDGIPDFRPKLAKR